MLLAALKLALRDNTCLAQSRCKLGMLLGASSHSLRPSARNSLHPVLLASLHSPPSLASLHQMIYIISPHLNPPPSPQACTSKMNLSEEVDLEDYVSRPDKISNAEIAAICQVGWGRCRWGRCTQ